MKNIFGTDGIRGRAGTFPLTPEHVMRLPQAIVRGLFSQNIATVVVGKDTRISGCAIESSLCAGFLSMGVDVVLTGVLPTPAISMLTRSLRASLGIVISASHNAHEDNGLKIFDHKGEKLSEAQEKKIETVFQKNDTPCLGSSWGRIHPLPDARGRYIEFAKASFPPSLSLKGVRLVVDCAHGATYQVAPLIFQELGATVIPLGVHPDGLNINGGCGCLYPNLMQQAVQDHQAHLGIAFDGDGDRLIVCDDNSQLLDGDQILALLSHVWHQQGLFKNPYVVATVMSNLGLERFLSTQGLTLVRTAVGDKHVAQGIKAHSALLGGEQSGHILLPQYHTSGDGLIASLQVISALLHKGRWQNPFPLFSSVPQILKNVRIQEPDALNNPLVQQCLEETKKKLGSKGRLLVRPSGTEHVMRIMVEGDDASFIQTLAHNIVECFEKNCTTPLPTPHVTPLPPPSS